MKVALATLFGSRLRERNSASVGTYDPPHRRHTRRTSRWAIIARAEDATRNGLTPMSINRVTALGASLVFSTLHTNDAPSAVTRLIDIGVKPFLVASSARAMMAQRLVRRVCRRCGGPYVPTEAELRSLSLDPNNVANATFMKGKGCNECNKTGYRGRFGIFEMFVVDDEIRKLIYDKVPSSELRTRAREIGMRTLREDGARKVLAGMTTPEEVIRATLGDVE